MTPSEHLQQALREGERLFHQGRTREAVDGMDAILSQAPDCIPAINNKAVALNRLGMHREAQQLLRRALHIENGNPDAVYNLLMIAIEQGDWNQLDALVCDYGRFLAEEELIAVREATEKKAGLTAPPAQAVFSGEASLAALSEKTLFFIVGCPKSGTTWLQNAVNGHPDILCAGESNINMIRRGLGYLQNEFNTDVEKINRKYIGQESFFSVIEPNDLEALFQIALGRLFKQLLNIKPARCLGMKNPDHLVNMEMTATLFSNMKYIHMIRDGRDVAVSGWYHNLRTEPETFRRMFPDFSAYVKNIAQAWNDRVRKARNFAVSNPHRYFELRYEDLHSIVTPTVQALLEFLEVDSSLRIVNRCLEAGSFRNLSGGRKNGRENSSSFFRKGIVGDWKNHLDASNLGLFEEHAGGLLQELGYE